MTVQSNQPRALPFLFLTETWERFGFYIVQGLLVLYMTDQFGFSDSESFQILGVFSALAYLSPLAGGYLANQFLGYKIAIISGGVFLTLGYALLALPEVKLLFFPALACIITGNGFFKPNVSSLLGAQYKIGDNRRETGFTIFYIGINLGALLAGLVSGYIVEYINWRASFALASIGLVLGLGTFLSGLKYTLSPTPEIANSSKINLFIFVGALIALLLISLLLRHYSLAKWLLPASGCLILLFLAMSIYQQPKKSRPKLIVLTILILSSIMFWTLFFQIFYAANLFVTRLVNQSFLGFHLTPTLFWGSESIFIIILGPLFAYLWHRLAKAHKNPSAILKFSLSLFFAGIGFLILTSSTYFPDRLGFVHPLWIFSAYLLITIGELLLSPIGLSAVTALAPSHLVSLMMGIWFVATGFGGIFAGLIAQLADVPKTITHNAEKMLIYQHAFLTYACLAFITAFVLFLIYIGTKRALALD